MDDKKTVIKVRNSTSQISGFIPPNLGELLGSYIKGWKSYKVGNKVRSEPYTVLVSLYKNQKSEFPTGLLSLVKRHSIEYGAEVEIIDERVRPINPPYKTHKEIPVREGLKPGIPIALEKARGIFEYSTGTGKTNFSIKLIAETGCKTLFVVPSLGLVRQAEEDIRKYIDTTIGIVGDNQKDYVSTSSYTYIPNIVIITIQSLWSIYKREPELFAKFVEHFESIIFDECHHVRYKPPTPKTINPFNSWYLLALEFINAYYRIGLTATAYSKGDLGRMMLEGATGKIQHSYNRIDAEADGVVCPFESRIYSVRCPSTTDWRSAYKQGLIFNDYHNETVIRIARELVSDGKHVLIIFDEVDDHIKEISKRIPEAAVLTGNDDGQTRLEVQKKFVAGEINIILTTVMSEGINIPSIDAIILASGKGSKDSVHKTVSQRIGRGSRKQTGEDKLLIVVDFLHEGNRYLHKHSINRINVMKELGGDIRFMNKEQKTMEHLLWK